MRADIEPDSVPVGLVVGTAAATPLQFSVAVSADVKPLTPVIRGELAHRGERSITTSPSGILNPGVLIEL